MRMTSEGSSQFPAGNFRRWLNRSTRLRAIRCATTRASLLAVKNAFGFTGRIVSDRITVISSFVRRS
jgi:hypothetical protein